MEDFDAGPSLSVFDAGPVGSPPGVNKEWVGGGLLAGKAFWRGLGLLVGNSMTPIEVHGGRQYLVVVQAPGVDPAPRLVTVANEGDRALLKIGPHGAKKASTLRVDLRWNREGRERRYPRGGLSLLIEDAETGVPLAVFEDLEPDQLQRAFAVPSRRIRVIAKGSSVHDSHHGILMVHRAMGRAEAVIDVEPGKEAIAALELQLGGKLRVTPTGRILDEEIPRTQAEFERWARQGRHGSEHWSGTWLTLLDADGREVEAVLWAGKAMQGTSAFGTHLMESWPLGRTGTSEVLPVGAYTLRARLLDRSPLLIPVTISAETVTDVDVSFR